MGMTTKRNRKTTFHSKMLFFALIGLALSSSYYDYGSNYGSYYGPDDGEIVWNHDTGKCALLLRKKEPLCKSERITVNMKLFKAARKDGHRSSLANK